jgi:hypothetical protein
VRYLPPRKVSDFVGKVTGFPIDGFVHVTDKLVYVLQINVKNLVKLLVLRLGVENVSIIETGQCVRNVKVVQYVSMKGVVHAVKSAGVVQYANTI